MILIADSGSTKTDWRTINNNGEIVEHETIGFNPYFISSEDIRKELNESTLNLSRSKVLEVHFYAAGCSTEKNKKLIQVVFQDFFDKANIHVEHDLLAAARALMGRREGLAAILGTGSNSCAYNGENIVENIRALGFILGDYGSGADLGKTFIKAYLENELTKDLELDFKNKYDLTTSDILDSVYKGNLPNRFLASFSPFIYENIGREEVLNLVKGRFQLFFEKNICKYENFESQELHLVGSIAYVYDEIIRSVAKKYEITIGRVIKKPIEDLLKYHLEIG